MGAEAHSGVFWPTTEGSTSIGRATETEGGGESDADACGSRPDRNDPLRYQRHLPRLGLGGGATRSPSRGSLSSSGAVS